jgi:hypothetical protein
MKNKANQRKNPAKGMMISLRKSSTNTNPKVKSLSLTKD